MLREVEKPKPNASRLKPQKRRLRGLPVVTGKVWCDLETVAAEELGENESEREECILEEVREWKW